MFNVWITTHLCVLSNERLSWNKKKLLRKSFFWNKINKKKRNSIKAQRLVRSSFCRMVNGKRDSLFKGNCELDREFLPMIDNLMLSLNPHRRTRKSWKQKHRFHCWQWQQDADNDDWQWFCWILSMKCLLFFVMKESVDLNNVANRSMNL